MTRLALTCLAALLVGAAAPSYTIDLAHYFPSPSVESISRVGVLSRARSYNRSATPVTAAALHAWLLRYDALLTDLQRHDSYVYVRAESDDRDTIDADADATLGKAEDVAYGRIVGAAAQLGRARLLSLTAGSGVRPYRYMLLTALRAAQHRLRPSDERVVSTLVSPALDATAAAYKALRKSSGPVTSQEDAYAALLRTIVLANNGVARLRGFRGAPEAAYFDKAIPAASVERVLAAVRSSGAYARFRSVATPPPQFKPEAVPIGGALASILAAETPVGPEYADQFSALLSQSSGRLEICTGARCDATGFSVGFSRVTSAVFFGNYDGSTNAMRAVAHESGHAVHRQLMNLYQPIAAYNDGPHFMFESFAIFSELVFLDRLYRTAQTKAQRAYYLDRFLSDAAFQVYGSAEQTDLESAIYRGVADGSVRTAGDLDALATETFSKYDPTSRADPSTPTAWARNALFFSDPLYDVNYLYAGLLAIRYFDEYERTPATFSARYVALLRNGFDRDPTALERDFLGIDLRDEAGLVTVADRLIGTRTQALAQLYSGDAPPR